MRHLIEHLFRCRSVYARFGLGSDCYFNDFGEY